MSPHSKFQLCPRWVVTCIAPSIQIPVLQATEARINYLGQPIGRPTIQNISHEKPLVMARAFAVPLEASSVIKEIFGASPNPLHDNNPC